MKDNVTEASTRGTKGKAKFTMATKRDNVSKARTCVTEGISIGKNKTNASSFKGEKDFSEAIGNGKELSVNPSSQDVPRKSCESNLPDSEYEMMREAMEEFHSYELCCKSREGRTRASLMFNCRESLAPPPHMAALVEQREELRKKFKASEERDALIIENLIRDMSSVQRPESKGPIKSSEESMALEIENLIRDTSSVHIPKSKGSSML